MQLSCTLKEKSPHCYLLEGQDGEQECWESLKGTHIPFNLGCILRFSQALVQGPCFSMYLPFRSSMSGTLMLNRSVHLKFSHPFSCFQTISNTNERISRKEIEQPPKLTHFCVSHLLKEVLPFTFLSSLGLRDR